MGTCDTTIFCALCAIVTKLDRLGNLTNGACRTCQLNTIVIETLDLIWLITKNN